MGEGTAKNVPATLVVPTVPDPESTVIMETVEEAALLGVPPPENIVLKKLYYCCLLQRIEFIIMRASLIQAFYTKSTGCKLYL